MSLSPVLFAFLVATVVTLEAFFPAIGEFLTLSRWSALFFTAATVLILVGVYSWNAESMSMVDLVVLACPLYQLAIGRMFLLRFRHAHGRLPSVIVGIASTPKADRQFVGAVFVLGLMPVLVLAWAGPRALHS